MAELCGTNEVKDTRMKKGQKIIVRKISKADLDKLLRGFESKYKMSSEEFYARFNHGELGDSRDMIMWAGYFAMAVRSGLRDLVRA